MLYKTRNFLSHSAAEKFRVLRPFAISPVNRETPFPQKAFPSPEGVKALAPGRDLQKLASVPQRPRRACFRMKTSAAADIFLYASTCEKGVLESPQAFQNP